MQCALTPVRFKKITGTHGKLLVLYPNTRFAYADLTVQRVIENQVNLWKLIDDPAWAELEKGVNKTALVAFKSYINSPLLFEKFSSMHAVTGLMTQTTHHIERCGARASWVSPLCSALSDDITAWQTKNATFRYFSADTRNQVMTKFIVRWDGVPPTQVGLKKPAHVLATFLDPYTTPLQASLPLGWEADCGKTIFWY